MSSIMNSALAGMNAASRRVEVGASNIANINTVGKPGATGAEAAYTPVDTVQFTGASGGPEVAVKERDPATSLSYQPSHPYASDEGYVEVQMWIWQRNWSITRSPSEVMKQI